MTVRATYPLAPFGGRFFDMSTLGEQVYQAAYSLADIRAKITLDDGVTVIPCVMESLENSRYTGEFGTDVTPSSIIRLPLSTIPEGKLLERDNVTVTNAQGQTFNVKIGLRKHAAGLVRLTMISTNG